MNMWQSHAQSVSPERAVFFRMMTNSPVVLSLSRGREGPVMPPTSPLPNLQKDCLFSVHLIQTDLSVDLFDSLVFPKENRQW